MKRVRKWAAGAVLMGAVPVLVDVAVNPYAQRGVARSWLYGAGTLGAAAVLAWAAGEYSRPEGR